MEEDDRRWPPCVNGIAVAMSVARIQAAAARNATPNDSVVTYVSSSMRPKNPNADLWSCSRFCRAS